MELDLTRLRNGIDKEVVVDLTYSFDESYLEHTGVTSIDDVSIIGVVTLDALGEINLDLDVTGTMVIPCAITLKPVDYPYSIHIDGSLEELLDSEALENNKKSQNSLDILPIIWENILMEIPMRVVSEDVSDAKLEGDGWRLITDDTKYENSELSKLKDLL